MPSPKPGNIKQPQSRLTNRRSFGSTDSNYSSYDLDSINPSLTLENKASVARDHLANERTFLAWLRTSLSFISIGIAITQLFRLTKISDDQRANEYNKEGKVLGIIFILLGVVFLSFGITRYFHSQYLMTKGHFPASRG
ncbi:15172_t:CDS:2, partial [Rhizophagus irregularis]